MTAKELIANFRMMGPQDLRVVLRYLADHAIDAQLRDGQRINDVTDCVAWLRELEEEAGIYTPAQARDLLHREDRRTGLHSLRVRGRVEPDACPRCGHVHQGMSECGEAIGGGRICRCEYEAVPA